MGLLQEELININDTKVDDPEDPRDPGILLKVLEENNSIVKANHYLVSIAVIYLYFNYIDTIQ